MDITKIQDQLDKINADITKREERIKTLEAREQKKKEALEKAIGMEVADYDKYSNYSKYTKKPNSMGHRFYDEYADIDFGISSDVAHEHWKEYYDLICVIRDQLSCWNKIFELEDKKTKYETQLQMEIAKQKSVDDLPPIMKELKDGIYEMLFNRYTKYRDIASEVANRLSGLYGSAKQKEMKRLAYEYGAVAVDYEYWLDVSDKTLENRAKKDSDFYVLDLVHRVTKKVGAIQDYRNLTVNGPAINGVVIGERGSTRLETIIAGGYNIQREHYRVILH